MKIQKTLEANSKTMSWKDIENIVFDNYEIRRQVDAITEQYPEAELDVKFNVEITVKN